MSDPRQDYADALVAYRDALARLKHAKAALVASKARPAPRTYRTYTLAEIDTFFPVNAPPYNE
jgi:hypothetical protein